jgi:hypothetical protein
MHTLGSYNIKTTTSVFDLDILEAYYLHLTNKNILTSKLKQSICKSALDIHCFSFLTNSHPPFQFLFFSQFNSVRTSYSKIEHYLHKSALLMTQSMIQSALNQLFKRTTRQQHRLHYCGAIRSQRQIYPRTTHGTTKA